VFHWSTSGKGKRRRKVRGREVEERWGKREG